MAPTPDLAAGSERQSASDKHYNTALGYLRAFIIVLVILHHSALAYLPIPYTPVFSLAEHRHSIRAISPVNDRQHSVVLSLIVIFNDKFFMSLMFLLSGLFVWKSLQAKGRSVFFRDRLMRLGLPFAAMVIISPLAYYTTYLQIGGTTGPPGYWHQWMSLDSWPAGPAWFLWLLMIFDIIAVRLSALIPGTSDFFRKMPSAVLRGPALFFVFLVLISSLSYIPMATIYDPNWAWWVWGPFTFQTSRIFLYMVYFLIGVVLGAYGIERTLLAPDSALARRWVIWVGVALAAFLMSIVTGNPSARMNQMLVSIFFILSCAASSLAFLALFLRFAGKRRKVFDSLSVNCYGMYVIHYVIVSWLLYAMLKAQLPATAKGSIVFVCALLLCWAAIAAIRRIPGVARVI
jgi:peptidoglycan/LPS O-acetylase OafA/YrhL